MRMTGWDMERSEGIVLLSGSGLVFMENISGMSETLAECL